jgi:RNA polymerase sigma-70 factor (ECF subfamily)
MSEKQEGELIRRAQAYDSAAFAEIYEGHYDSIYAYILYRVGETQVAEDLAAEVFLRALEGIGSFQFRGIAITSWLYRIANNLMGDYFRRQRRHGTLPLREDLLPTESNPSETIEKQQTYRQLQQALGVLTGEQRQVVLLKFVQGLDNETIAGILGKSEGAIKSLQHRALSTMERVLEK